MTTDAILLERDLSSVSPPPARFPGTVLMPFDRERHIPEARDLLNTAYMTGLGDVMEAAVWWQMIESDEEFDPALLFVLADEPTGRMIGFAHCWLSGFIKDIAIHQDYQRLGYGSYLMSVIFDRFVEMGFHMVRLKVRPNNSAVGFYERLGMQQTAAEPA
tara:strand:- start:7959 stop:8438 length:480 start_codon:yes stop_codon:yes gene_type:complete